MKHTLVAWMRDKPGVLNQVSGLLRRRNFNIDSLQVGHSEQVGISRMTFVVDGDELMVDQVIKQLRKTIDVTRVDNIGDRLCVMRELALVRTRTTPETRSEIMQIVDIYRAEVVDVGLESMVVQIVGSEDRVDSLIGLLENFGVLEMGRTGRVAMQRGNPERRKRGTSVWRAHANGLEAATAKDLFSTSGV